MRYDAQTYETRGFIDLSGKVQEMAQKPRFWQITAKAITKDPKLANNNLSIKFNPTDRLKLGELSTTIVNNYIHDGDNFLPDCVSL